MSLAELVILSVTVEGRSKSVVARDYGITRYWVHQLVARYESEGAAAFVCPAHGDRIPTRGRLASRSRT